MTEQKPRDLELPDEMEYPLQLREKYELLECLSVSRDTETLLAREKGSTDLVTVKCFLKEHPLYGLSEPEPLRSLTAPPLPRFLGEYRNEGMRCTLRQYIPGEPLSRVQKGKWSEEEVLETGIRLCDQLQHLHGAEPPIIHRDIKPENIIMREDGTPVLIDFGIARVCSGKDMDTAILGTRGFAPPEQYGFAQTDRRSDIYSLGLVLNWMLRGEDEPPKKAETPLERVITRMTAFDPDRRYDHVLQVKAALQKVEPRRCRRRRFFHAAAAVVAAAAVLAGGVMLARRGMQNIPFSSPLIREAVRQSLGLPEGAVITEKMLPQVSGVYVVADRAYPDADSFYAAVNEWYAGGRAGRGDVINLEDIRGMPQLEDVCLAAQELEDISALAELRRVSRVELKHNRVRDISVLAGMDRLTYVGINGNPVTDITPLTKCPNLRFLDLCDVQNYDPKTIAELGNFDYLDLANYTQSYRYLAGKSVSVLKLSWSGIQSLEDLKEVDRLEELDISHTAVSDLTPLNGHRGLKRLNIAADPVRDLTPLMSLPMLESVVLSSEMAPLAEELKDPPFEIRYE